METSPAVKKIVVMGDSISDCGRARPVGEGSPDALGNGYVRLLDAMVSVDHPEWRLHFVNMGVSGNTSRDLAVRWQVDLVQQKPDYALLQIGINDTWRYFDRPLQPEVHVTTEEYRANLNAMLDGAEAIGCKVILSSPFFMEPNRDDPMRAAADRYRAEMARCAKERGLPYIDLQERFDAVLACHYSCRMALDRVHPNTMGQYVIASALEQAFEGIFGVV